MKRVSPSKSVVRARKRQAEVKVCKSLKTQLLCCLVAMTAFQYPLKALVVANFSAASNDRFANNTGSFVGGAYDFSGVGRTADGNWATRIGSNYFLSADHFHPSTGESVTFYNTNNPSGSSFSYTVAGGNKVSGTDFWVGYFDTAIHGSVKTYAWTKTPANSVADTGLLGATLLMMGKSATADATYGGGLITDVAVGQNRLESWFEQGTTTVPAPLVSIPYAAAGWDQMVLFQNTSADTFPWTALPSEGYMETGDSGSPLFSISGSNLVLQGVAWSAPSGLPGNFIDGPGDPPVADPLELRNASFYSYVGSYESGMNSAIALVPEPSTFVLVALGAGLVFRRRNRRG